MAVSIRVEEDSGVAVATCSGVLGGGDAREGATALWQIQGWPGRSAVWDFRGAEFGASPLDARKIAEFILEHQPEPPPAKMAFVTQRDVDFGMARMFGVYREDPRTLFCVFRDFDEAMSWARSLEPGAA